MTYNFYKGDVISISITAADTFGTSATLGSASYEIYTPEGSSMGSGNFISQGNGTWTFVKQTTSSWGTGVYQVKVFGTIGTYVNVDWTQFRIVERWPYE